MKDRESYSSTPMDERKVNVVHRAYLIQKSLSVYDLGEEDELAHLESLIDRIEEILDTPFKG